MKCTGNCSRCKYVAECYGSPFPLFFFKMHACCSPYKPCRLADVFNRMHVVSRALKFDYG